MFGFRGSIAIVHHRGPLHSAMHADREFNFTTVTQFVVCSVPVRCEVCCVEVVKCVKSSCTVVTVSAFAVKQKLKSVIVKVHRKMATSVHPHAQTPLDRLGQGANHVSNVSEGGLRIIEIPAQRDNIMLNNTCVMIILCISSCGVINMM